MNEWGWQQQQQRAPAQVHVHVGEVAVLVKVFYIKREFVLFYFVGENYCCLNRLGLSEDKGLILLLGAFCLLGAW